MTHSMAIRFMAAVAALLATVPAGALADEQELLNADRLIEFSWRSFANPSAAGSGAQLNAVNVAAFQVLLSEN